MGHDIKRSSRVERQTDGRKMGPLQRRRFVLSGSMAKKRCAIKSRSRAGAERCASGSVARASSGRFFMASPMI